MKKSSALLGLLALLGVGVGVGGAVLLSARHGKPTAWPAPPATLQSPPAGFIFCAQHSRASYDAILQPYNTQAVLDAELQMLLATGADTIRIDIGYDAFAQNDAAAISALDTLVSEIKAAGKKLCIADAAQEAFRSSKQTWDNFELLWLERVAALAKRYVPDYYITIKEPGWYFPMISNLWSSAGAQASTWLSLQQALYGTVKTYSTNAQVGIAIAASSLFDRSLNEGIAKLMLTSPYSDFAGFDIYAYPDYLNTVEFLALNATTKPIWIPECWPGPLPNTNPVNDPDDLKSMYALFLKNPATAMMNPFYTDDFVDYTMPSDAGSLVGLYSTSRTPAFVAYEQITKL